MTAAQRVAIEAEKLAWLDKVQLLKGNHGELAQGACVMEAAAYLAGEPHSDHPSCVSPVIAAFLRRWNDDLDDAGRQTLKPYAAKVVGTRATKAIESGRAWMATDWMVRVHAPAWLELGGMKEQADALRALPELTGPGIASKAQPTIDGARTKAAAARDAARAAAGDAAGDAAWAAAREKAGAAAGDAAGAAAWAAAWDAAREKAGDAAGAAAWAAAWDAAWDAAWEKLKPTVISLQASALELLDRMIELSGGGVGDEADKAAAI